ncbi:MAG: hypothetical protein P8R04_00950, partial [Gammaproteobacteria bacterium]|nr:hypothetical protein [Gammaproteobacteria bacterium]
MRSWPAIVWAVIWSMWGVIALVLVVLRFQTTVELTYFLPAPSTESEQILIDRLGQGPGSRF